MTPRSDVRLVQDPVLTAIPWLRHGFSERGGGVSSGRFASLNLGPRSGDDADAVRANRDRFLQAAGTGAAVVLAPRQIHGNEVTVVRAGASPPERGVVPGDAVVTDAPGTALMILAADCVPVLLVDTERRVIAAIHAGWRGTAGAIAAGAVAAMRYALGSDPRTLRAALGPAIGRCCYEVGPEVLAAVAAATPLAPERYVDPLPAGKGYLDLAAANIAQLVAAGLAPAAVRAVDLCTACRVDRFYSHRREGEPTGRGGAVIAVAS